MFGPCYYMTNNIPGQTEHVIKSQKAIGNEAVCQYEGTSYDIKVIGGGRGGNVHKHQIYSHQSQSRSFKEPQDL